MATGSAKARDKSPAEQAAEQLQDAQATGTEDTGRPEADTDAVAAQAKADARECPEGVDMGDWLNRHPQPGYVGGDGPVQPDAYNPDATRRREYPSEEEQESPPTHYLTNGPIYLGGNGETGTVPVLAYHTNYPVLPHDVLRHGWRHLVRLPHEPHPDDAQAPASANTKE